jgi:hypothetical protein
MAADRTVEVRVPTGLADQATEAALPTPVDAVADIDLFATEADSWMGWSAGQACSIPFSTKQVLNFPA